MTLYYDERFHFEIMFIASHNSSKKNFITFVIIDF